MIFKLKLVSNSSTNSFIGIGWKFESIYELFENIKEFCPVSEEEFFKEKNTNPAYFYYSDYEEFISECYDSLFKKYFDYDKICIHTGCDGIIYVACEIEEDSNPKKFIENIEKANSICEEKNVIADKLRKELENPYMINDTWYSG